MTRYLKSIIRCMDIVLALWLSVQVLGVVRANDAGGGVAGVGANVTLTETSTTVTLDNGVIQAIIQKSSGKVSSYKLNGTQMVDPANPIYYSMDGGTTYEQPSGCVYSLVVNRTDHIEISCKRTWNANAGYKHAVDIDLHYVLRRGDTGLYAFAILDHPSSYPATSVGEWRIVWKLPRSSTTFTFERAYVDDQRNWEMPSYYDYQQALPTGIGEIVKLTTGVRAGKYDGKYTYSARYFDIGTWGHASDLEKKGVWFVLGGHDYFNDGPTKQDLTSSESYILMHFGRNHYDGSGISLAAGESWRKMFGPFLLYCNATTTSTNAGNALWADAKAQVLAEKSAWPYAWLSTEDHPLAAARGTVTGKMVYQDVLKPSVSAANAYVGLAAPEDSDGSWQYQSKKYQYWTRADAQGNFTIPAVRPGTYTLYSFNDGAVGEYSKVGIVVTANAINSQGSLVWNIPRSGASLAWEIGVPDRTAKEFRHGDDYFTPYLWDVYPTEFANPLVFRIGTDDASRQFNYVHSAYPTKTNGVTTWGTWDWQLQFDLAAVPRTGNATLTFAIASSNYARLYLYVNDVNTAFTRISAANDGGNALLRQGIHGKYSVVRVSVPVSRLRVGSNTMILRQSTSDTASHVMYDYIGMELPAFPPPPPSSGRTITWKGGNTASMNTWDVGTTSSFLIGATPTSFTAGDVVQFDATGSNSTSVTLTGQIEANALVINASKDYSLTGTGQLSGAMGITKLGSGKLTLSTAQTHTGGVQILAGNVTLANDVANTSGLGTGDVTLGGGSLTMYNNFGSSNASSWNIEVPAGTTGTLNADSRCELSGKLTGAGTFNLVMPDGAIRTSLTGDWSGFTGRLNASASSGSADFRMARDYSWPGLGSAALYLGPGVSAVYAGNLNTGNGTTVAFGEFSGASTSALKGGAIAGRRINYRIGGLNTDATFSGSIAEQANGMTYLTKVGTGTWTLSGNGSINGATVVENGILRLTGALTQSASLTVQTGARLELTGTVTASTVSIADGGMCDSSGTIQASVTNDGTVRCAAGALTVSGDFTNRGLVRLTGGARLAIGGVFTNTGVVDLIDADQTLPPGFVNQGLVLTTRPAANLLWTGAASGAWDTKESINWQSGTIADVFRAGDVVRFDDSSAVTEILLSGSVSPSQVTVATDQAFSFGGEGTIVGAADLIKNGTGVLSLARSHAFTGSVQVLAGTLKMGLDAAFPAASGFSLASGANLDVSGVNQTFSIGTSQSLAGSGTVQGNMNVDGQLLPGDTLGTLAVTGQLTLNSNSRVTMQLGTTSDRVTVGGTLKANGEISIEPVQGFGAGIYTLFTYAGTLNTAGLRLSQPPSGFDWQISTLAPGELRLVVTRVLTALEQWQVLWFGDETLPAAAMTADPDLDGQTNEDEYAAGTNPTSAASVATLYWRGDGVSNAWNSGSAASFWNGRRLCAFTNGNPVAFDASGAGNATINLTSSVAPVSMIVDSASNFTLAGSGSVTGSTSIVKKGSGQLNLNLANTFTGGVTIEAGTVASGHANGLGTGTVNLAGGTWAMGRLAPPNAVLVSANSTLTGGDAGGTHGVKAISGAAQLSVLATNVFDFEGAMTAFSGRVVLGGTGSFRFNGSGGSALADFDLGTRSLTGRNSGTYQLGSVTGTTAASLTNNSASSITFVIGGNGKSTTYAGGISNGNGTTSVIKTGTGVTVLSGNASHTGNTTVSAGTLAVMGTINASSLNVSNGATVAGQGSLATTTIANGGKLSPGLAGVGTITVTGALNLNAGAIVDMELGRLQDRIAVTGNLTLNGTLNVIDLGGLVGEFVLMTYSGTLSGNGLALGSVPDGVSCVLSTTTPGQVRLRVQPVRYAAWQRAYFDANELNNPALSGSQAVVAGDGLSNLMKYALGLPAKTSTAAGLECSATATHWRMLYRRPAQRDDLTYAVEASPDLSPGSWTTQNVEHTRINNQDPETWQAQIPRNSSARFLRLKVYK